MVRLAKGINDAKKYRQKLRRLKNSRGEREREKERERKKERVPFSLLRSSRRSHPSREMIKRPTSYSISRSSTCIPNLSATLLRTFARPFLSSFSCPSPYLLLCSFSSLSLSRSIAHTYTHRHTHYFSPSPSASSSFFLPRVFCQEPSRAEASRTALKQKRSDVKCDYESCESSSRTRMLR